MAKREEKKDGRISVPIVDWLQNVKILSSVKVLQFDFSHSGQNSITVKAFFFLSNFSGNNIERVFQIIYLRSFENTYNLNPDYVLRITTI